ncbi:hypothetical protein FOCC_FOCC015184 [Frankliniella occidentalis]|nr:hypothetical protein FOCC_FOCC015184 [Frankliniella occidentalis]
MIKLKTISNFDRVRTESRLNRLMTVVCYANFFETKEYFLNEDSLQVQHYPSADTFTLFSAIDDSPVLALQHPIRSSLFASSSRTGISWPG